MAENWVCFLKDSSNFEKGSFKQRELTDNKKRPMTMTLAKEKQSGATIIQKIEYPKSKWDVMNAQSHCLSQGGRFNKLKESDFPKPKVIKKKIRPLPKKNEVKKAVVSSMDAGGKVPYEPRLDHNRLKNYDPNKHIDHTLVSVIAGLGLTGGGTIDKNVTLSINGTYNTTRIINTDSPYTIVSTDHVIFADTDGGAIIVNLPAGTDGKNYKIINCGSSGNDLTVNPNGTEQLYGDGAGVGLDLIDAENINIHFEILENWY